jgi:hypothetical protein
MNSIPVQPPPPAPSPADDPRADAVAARLDRLQRRLADLAAAALAADSETRRQRAAGRRP